MKDIAAFDLYIMAKLLKDIIKIFLIIQMKRILKR